MTHWRTFAAVRLALIVLALAMDWPPLLWFVIGAALPEIALYRCRQQFAAERHNYVTALESARNVMQVSDRHINEQEALIRQMQHALEDAGIALDAANRALERRGERWGVLDLSSTGKTH